MAAGTPTSTRTDEARTGEDGKGEAGAAAQDSTPRLSLLDLPDELIARIYDQVQASLVYEVGRSLLCMVQTLAVSKRVYRIGLPIYLRDLFAYNFASVDTICTAIIERADVRHAAESLSYVFCSIMPRMQLAALARLQHLVVLELHFSRGKAVPREATELLRRLPGLEDLSMMAFEPLEDDEFLLAEACPGLRTLHLRGEGYFESFARRDIPLLHRLAIHVDEDAIAQLPSPLPPARILQFEAAGNAVYDPSNYVQALLDVLMGLIRDPAAIRSMHKFELDCRPEDEDVWVVRAPGVPLADLVPHLSILASGNLEVLDIHELAAVEWPEEATSIRFLTLACYVRTVPNIPHRSRKLAKVLHRNQNAVERALRDPPVAALLIFLRTTSVLQLSYGSIDESGEMRWWRSSVDEDFVHCDYFELE
ncbi:hypothetical protein JCM10450v2_005706 [Rhodotorula kratochvilovae]